MQQPSAERIWTAAQQLLRTILNPDIYNLWFQPLQARDLTGDEITLEVANDFCEVWLKDNYLGLIRDVLASAAGQHLKVNFRVVAPPKAPSAVNGSEAVVATKADAEPDKPSTQKDHNFNPKNTFETFVVGSNNTFAHAAAMAVSQSPGKSYNPLFLYGGVGLGKTHLLHAIGQHVVSNKRAARVTYVTSERFTNEFIDAIQNSQLVRFRRRYRQTDVFLIDDIQFLAGKERIQEEFFHTFNSLHDAHKQIVLTCDRYPKEVAGLEERLKSRFGWGLTVAIEQPELETSVAILMSKAAAEGETLPEEVAFFLAQRIRSNVRELEGALRRVLANSRFTGQPITLDFAKDALRDVLALQEKLVTVENIQKTVAEYFKIRVADLLSKRRSRSIARPRQIAMALAKELTTHSLPEIGDAFGGRDHTTVLHACRRVKELRETETRVAEDYNNLLRTLTT